MLSCNTHPDSRDFTSPLSHVIALSMYASLRESHSCPLWLYIIHAQYMSMLLSLYQGINIRQLDSVILTRLFQIFFKKNLFFP